MGDPHTQSQWPQRNVRAAAMLGVTGLVAVAMATYLPDMPARADNAPTPQFQTDAAGVTGETGPASTTGPTGVMNPPADFGILACNEEAVGFAGGVNGSGLGYFESHNMIASRKLAYNKHLGTAMLSEGLTQELLYIPDANNIPSDLVNYACSTVESIVVKQQLVEYIGKSPRTLPRNIGLPGVTVRSGAVAVVEAINSQPKLPSAIKRINGSHSVSGDDSPVAHGTPYSPATTVVSTRFILPQHPQGELGIVDEVIATPNAPYLGTTAPGNNITIPERTEYGELHITWLKQTAPYRPKAKRVSLFRATPSSS